jgi:hypothetical protein
MRELARQNYNMNEYDLVDTETGDIVRDDSGGLKSRGLSLRRKVKF